MVLLHSSTINLYNMKRTKDVRLEISLRVEVIKVVRDSQLCISSVFLIKGLIVI